VNQMQHDFVGSPVAQDFGKTLGTPFKVVLCNGVKSKVDKATGKTVLEITDLPGLICSILQTRVTHPRKLSGDDLKFIRSSLGWKSNAVAELLELTPEHYSRCETGVKTLSSSVERFYRMYVFLQAARKRKALQEKALKQKKRKPSSAEVQDATEALEAFMTVFVEMKIEYLYHAGDELEFSFIRRPRRNQKDCGKVDHIGKWRTQPAPCAEAA